MSEWDDDTSFQELKGLVTSLSVVNDAAERTVKFGTDFTQVRTKFEDRRQNILQCEELGRRAFPQATKKCFLKVDASLSVPELLPKIDYDAR